MAKVGGDKPLVWLHGEVKTPPFSSVARLEAGALLRRLQRGETLTMPHARTMPAIGRRCQELRVVDPGPQLARDPTASTEMRS